MGIPYSVLSQVNPGYSLAFHQELQDLYRGGYQAQANATRYLPKLYRERKIAWEERCRSAAYIGYLGQICDYYTSALFKQPLAVSPDQDESPTGFDKDFYEAFATDCDLTGSSVVEFIRGVFTSALVHKKALVACDFPTVDGPIVSRKDEDANGSARAYLLKVEASELIDWEIDSTVRRKVQIPGNGVVEFDVNRFKWCVLKRVSAPRASVTASRNTTVEEYKVWERDTSGNGVWSLYRATFETNKPPRPEDDVPLVARGATSFDCIPLIELSIPDGLWIGNKVGPLNKEHWQRRSILNASENAGLISIPYINLGPEIGVGGGEMPSEVQQDGGRGETLQSQLNAKGYMVLGADDKIGFAAPDGKMQDSTENRIAKLVDEIFRVSHMMASSVSSTSNAMGRSGASKAEDRMATSLILGAFGAIVRDFARRLYEVVAAGRSETIVWQVHGLDKFDLYDRAEMLTEAVDVDAVSIPSVTFKTAYKTELATRLLPNMSPEMAQQVAIEVEAGVAEEVQAKKDAAHAMADAQAAPGAFPEGGLINPDKRMKPNFPNKMPASSGKPGPAKTAPKPKA